MANLQAVVDFAREYGLVSIINNTFDSPTNFRPLELGYDISINSCTKYLNGNYDIVAGAIIYKAGLVEKIAQFLEKHPALPE